MTEQEINELTIAGTAVELAMRLLGEDSPICTVVDTALPDYDRILMNDGYAKPTLEMFESELTEYKAELNAVRVEAEELAAAEEIARLLEESYVIRRVEITAGYKKYLHLAIAHSATMQKNWHKYLAGDFQAELKLLDGQQLAEMEELIVNAENQTASTEIARIAAAAALNTMNKCNEAIAYIINHNQTEYMLGGIDDAGLDSLEVTFADIFKALSGYRPKKAAIAIMAVDLAGTIYTEEQRTDILEILGA